MEKISNYVNNVFSSLPKTKTVSDLKQNIIDSMNEKYHELIRQGKNQNEAFGIVISEFGDIEEIKRELAEEPKESPIHESALTESLDQQGSIIPPVFPVSPEREEEYTQAKRTFAKVLPFSIALFFTAVIVILNAERIGIDNLFSKNGEVSFFTLLIFFLLITTGVGLLVYFGPRLSQYEDVQLYYKSIYKNVASGGSFVIDSYRKSQYEKERKKFSIILPISISLFILSVILPLYFNSYQKSMENIGISLFLIIICIGVVLLVHFGYRLSYFEEIKAYNEGLHYRNTGEISEDYGKNHAYSGFVYMMATVIFLGLGFFKGLWHPGWLVFVLAAGITSLMNIHSNKN